MKIKFKNFNSGMTYVELIVVLSIFSIMSGIATFNYGSFQGKVDIKGLLNDVALKVVEAQRSAVYGELTTHTYISNWKPAYGIYFTVLTTGLADNKSFNYFADLDNQRDYDDSTCNPGNLATECLEKINITKGNIVSSIRAYYVSSLDHNINDVTVIFTRPDNSPNILSTSALSSDLSHVEITFTSPKGPTGKVKIYSSGRIQIN